MKTPYLIQRGTINKDRNPDDAAPSIAEDRDASPMHAAARFRANELPLVELR